MKYTVSPGGIPSEGILFVDHQKEHRSGHLGHALVEYEDGKLLAFYSNCSGERGEGHTGYGWVEYKRSLDGGETWGEPQVLPYAARMFLDGEYYVACEKAVRAPDGSIVVCCLLSTAKNAWEPFGIPMIIRSTDGGESWTEPVPLCGEPGRTYDLRVHEDTIFALHFANDAEVSFTGNKPEHQYKLLVSQDNGVTFTERAVVPFDTEGRGYGSLLFSPDGMLAAYAYNCHDEYHLDYCVSGDLGKTWTEPARCECRKRIRNPQTAYLNGLCFLHGRSGCDDPEPPYNFVLYTSEDGVHWDDGVYMSVPHEGGSGRSCYYSNNLVVGALGEGKKRLLIQASDPYDGPRTNIRHWWIDVEE